MIGIIDYGLGNLRSVSGAVAKVGFESVITDNVDTLRKADKLILPGVGAFGDGMKNLQERKLIDPLTQMVVREKKAILGICLGAQLFAKSSEEFGYHGGLGWIDAQVVRLNPEGGLRVPHVGWNECIQLKSSPIFEGIPKDALFYYVHSFYIAGNDPKLVIGQCDYGMKVTSAVQQGNIYATQFHPEKSQQYGLQLLKNFITLC
ncbi:imidazole glycerol phosphate synthase subunit HisH [Candidatus Uhrbacteria bacterium]|nr:imidazole glycerol phosphate synthase subunit HisH [Candidatus Uhrbacteria bacterium]